MMPYDLSALNGASFNQFDASLLLTLGNGLSQNGDVYMASPTGVGLALYDNWLGTTNSGPDPSDTVSINTFIPATATPNILEYTTTDADHSVNPPTGGIGAELIATNSTGYLFEQLTGYVPGAHPSITPDGQYFILSSVNLQVDDANGNFVGEGATSSQLTFFVPEPSTMMLMPLMFLALIVVRIPMVRSFLAAR